MEISGLGYVGLVSPDPGAWLRFGSEVLGLMPSRVLPAEAFSVAGVVDSGPMSRGSGVAPDGSVDLKVDERQWRIAVHEGEEPGLAYLGFEVADEPAFDRALISLEERAVAASDASAEETSRPRSSDAGRYSDHVYARPTQERSDAFLLHAESRWVRRRDRYRRTARRYRLGRA